MSNLIGIIGAMDIEVNDLISDMTEKEVKVISGITFTKGKLCGKEVVIAKCGIGKVFAALCAQTMILEYKPLCIINSGVGGTLDENISIMDTVVATKVCQHDMDTTALGDDKGLISGVNTVFMKTDGKVSDILVKSAKINNVKTLMGTIASGDLFVADAEQKKEIAKTFGASVCEMEGGAIGQVCYVNKMPFAVLRTISDGKGEAMDFNTFAEKAAKQSTDIIKTFLNNM